MLGNILILIVLVVTIPRWAMVLQQIDTFQIGGVPLAAVGEALVLELGCLYVLSVYTRCQSHDLRYHAAWLARHEINQERGRRTLKPKRDPRIAGFQRLPAILLLLEGLTVTAQTPFLAAQMLNTPTPELLSSWGQVAVWVYSLLLVISPGVMTVALGFARHYENTLTVIAGSDRPAVADLIDRLSVAISNALARLSEIRKRAGQLQPDTQKPFVQQPQTVQPQKMVTTAVADGLSKTDVTMRAHLDSLRVQLSKKAAAEGNDNGHVFTRADAQELLKLSSSYVKNILYYGRQIGVVDLLDGNRYELQEAPLCQA